METRLLSITFSNRLCSQHIPRRQPMGTAAVQRRRRAALVSTCLVLALATISTAQACTSYIVAAHASTDGSVLIGRNDDGEGAVAPNWLVHHPARDGPAPFTANLNSLTLLLPGPGLAYFSLPSGPLADPSSGRNTTGEAAGWNSAGVAVSATESIYNSAAALAADPFNEVDGIIEDAIPSLLLPQVRRAEPSRTWLCAGRVQAPAIASVHMCRGEEPMQAGCGQQCIQHQAEQV